MALTIEQKEDVRKLRRSGYGYGKIAKKLNLNRDQVRDYCRTKNANLTGEMFLSKERECKKCGKKFMYNTPSQVFCSSECRIKNRYTPKPKPKQKCLNCGNEINNKSASAKYCSDECYKEHNTIKKVCLVCNKTFETTNQNKKFCSGKCMGNDRIKRLGNQRIIVNCLYCGKEVETTENKPAMYCGRTCQGKHKRKSHYQFAKELLEIHKGELVPLEQYISSDKVIKCLCIKCGNEIKRKAARFIGTYKTGCGKCNSGARMSAEASRIEQYLINNQIEYETEYYFDDLKARGYLFFDFAVIKDDELKMLIEYDGRQHFEPVESWGGMEELKRIQRNDKLKDNYVKKHNIPLLRIKFDCENIESVLEEKINKFIL